MRLTIKGIPPPKKNSRRIFKVQGKTVSLPSESYARWHDDVWRQLPQHIEKVPEPCVISIAYWMPDNRRRDLTNISESIMDFLVDRAIISDDRWQVVCALRFLAMGIDKENPRMEIDINAFSDGNQEAGI